jgi:acyl-CoA hydrolase
VLSRAHALTAINSAVQVSLDGAVNAESVGDRLLSGPGGQPDFAEAAHWSPGAVGIIALPATAAGGKASRIVPRIDGVTTVPRHLADRVVTEHGVAALRGRTIHERADALRAIADPAFRDALGAP